MITCEKIKQDIIKNYYCQCFTWLYKGKPCGIDPAGEKDGSITYIMWCGDHDFEAKNWQEVFETKLFDGKPLKDILGDIQDYDAG